MQKLLILFLATAVYTTDHCAAAAAGAGAGAAKQSSDLSTQLKDALKKEDNKAITDLIKTGARLSPKDLYEIKYDGKLLKYDLLPHPRICENDQVKIVKHFFNKNKMSEDELLNFIAQGPRLSNENVNSIISERGYSMDHNGLQKALNIFTQLGYTAKSLNLEVLLLIILSIEPINPHVIKLLLEFGVDPYKKINDQSFVSALETRKSLPYEKERIEKAEKVLHEFQKQQATKHGGPAIEHDED